MPEYAAPSVFIEEIAFGPKPIEGAGTTTTAFLGETERGPLRPQLVNSYDDYLRIFGGDFGGDKYLPYAVNAFFENGGRRAYIARIVGENACVASLQIGSLHVSAIGPGAAFERVWVRVDPASTIDHDGNPTGFRLWTAYWEASQQTGFDLKDPFDQRNGEQSSQPSVVERFDDLSLDPASPDYWDIRVNQGNSSLIEITVDDGAGIDDIIASGGLLQGGANGGAPNIGHFEGASADIDRRTGLAALALEQYREVSILAAPGQTAPEVLRALIAHCESNRFRFAVLDGPQNVADASGLDPSSTIADTRFGALYHPWVIVSDPRTGGRIEIPPSGAVCGIYARTDTSRGVWKAPANETVIGALDLKYHIDTPTQEILNPRGVNCIRRLPSRGIRVWGARTLSSDPMWKYVSVCRLFLFLEASIYLGTQWVVFERNDVRLWTKVKQAVTAFLHAQWRQGAFVGIREEEAFFVAIGNTTMTRDDIVNGRLIIEIGIAAVQPAEFVVFRIFQKTQETSE